MADVNELIRYQFRLVTFLSLQPYMYLRQHVRSDVKLYLVWLISIGRYSECVITVRYVFDRILSVLICFRIKPYGPQTVIALVSY